MKHTWIRKNGQIHTSTMDLFYNDKFTSTNKTMIESYTYIINPFHCKLKKFKIKFKTIFFNSWNLDFIFKTAAFRAPSWGYRHSFLWFFFTRISICFLVILHHWNATPVATLPSSWPSLWWNGIGWCSRTAKGDITIHSHPVQLLYHHLPSKLVTAPLGVTTHSLRAPALT